MDHSHHASIITEQIKMKTKIDEDESEFKKINLCLRLLSPAKQRVNLMMA